MSVPNSLFTKTVTIASGAALSGVLSLNGEFAIVGLIVPASWTAAAIAFQTSMDPIAVFPTDAAPTNFYHVYDETGQHVVATGATGVVAGSAVMLSGNSYIVGRHFKLRSADYSSLGSNTNQAADRTITVIYRSA